MIEDLRRLLRPASTSGGIDERGQRCADDGSSRIPDLPGVDLAIGLDHARDQGLAHIFILEEGDLLTGEKFGEGVVTKGTTQTTQT